MTSDAAARGADRPPGRDTAAARAAAPGGEHGAATDDPAARPHPPWWSPDGPEAGREEGSWRPAQLLAWLRPTPAELVGLVLLVVGSVAATLVWWGQSVTGPVGAEQLQGVGAELTAPDVATTPAGGTALESPDGRTGATGSADDLVDAGAATVAVTVHVSGAVSRPGLVTLPSGGRVGDAVVAAGGLTTQADARRVNLARTLVDGEHVHLPRIGEQPPAPVAPTGGDAPANGAGAGEQSGEAPLDLNRATAAELEELPGIGPARAAAIVEHRERNGPFTVPGDLRAVPGIGEATFQNLAPLVVVR